MEEDNRNAYSEVIEILKLIDDEKKLEALPIEMLEVLKSKANPEYKPQISIEIPLEEQNLQDETYRILSWIAAKYWDEDIEENNLMQQNTENITEKTQNIPVQEFKEINEKQETHETPNNTEKNIEKQTENEEQPKQIEQIEENSAQSLLPILHKDLKWYQKIKIRIIEILNKIFKRNKNLTSDKKGIT